MNSGQKGVAAENKGKDPQQVPAILLRHGEQTAVMAGDREHGGAIGIAHPRKKEALI
jgi:hypothetical protein